jgi:hypothetical protein
MKTKSFTAALLACSLTLATSLRADDPTDPAVQSPPGQPHPGQSAQSSKDQGRAESASSPAYLGATHVMGREVRNVMGEHLGVIQDVIIGLNSDTPPFAIIRSGGALGIGGMRVAVPLKDLRYSSDTKLFNLAVTKEQFISASPTPTGGWTSVADQDWAAKIDRFYGDPTKSDLSQSGRPSLSESDGSREFIRDPAPPNPATGPEAQPTTVPTPVDQVGTIPQRKPADGDLSAKVNVLIDHYAGLAAGGAVQSTVENGVVTLKGKVATAAQKQDLESQIKALSGVITVVDDQLSAPNE